MSITVASITLAHQQQLTVEATSISALEEQINQHQQELENINEEISRVSDEQDLLEEKIADLNAEIINMMTSIGLKEDEIAAKETAIAEKEVEIAQTQQEYEAAKQKEEEQYQAMKRQIQFMYENDGNSILTVLFGSTDFGDLLNRADYIESIYAYSKRMLDEFEATKNQAQDLWNKLEQDKQQLQTDKELLEQDRQLMQEQKEQQDILLAEKRRESANFEAELQRYRQEAAAAKTQIQQEQKELKKLKEQQKKKPTTNAASGSYTVTAFDISTIDNASGSDLGKRIAKYACQYIGNPYVAGGTSLTNGADCSGFTYRVYQDFGYTLPRTSFEQRSVGTGVEYANAQPGDLICYSGHVALYVGGGKIVHASSARTGIKISNATYREILAVRRII